MTVHITCALMCPRYSCGCVTQAISQFGEIPRTQLKIDSWYPVDIPTPDTMVLEKALSVETHSSIRALLGSPYHLP